MTSSCDSNMCAASDGIIFLKRLGKDDVSERYVSWLNCPQINRFLECRHSSHTLESTRGYVESLGSPESHELLYGIYLHANDNHIGNIKLGPINFIHRHATVGLLIGEPTEWGKGYGSRAIKLLSDYALGQLGLVSLNAGCYSNNIGSYKSFLKAGWELAGEIKSHWIDSTGSRTNELILTIQKPQTITLAESGGISLIGGGALMVDIAKHLRDLGYSVCAVLSPRHNEAQVRESLTTLGCSVRVTENINKDVQTLSKLRHFNRICICLGPAWIFTNKVLEIYEGRIFNFNGIPIPNYLGGAHFTWQILNRDKSGGAYMQQISSIVDRGLVACSEDYSLPKECKTPIDYEEFNYKKAFSFLKSFAEKHLVRGIPIKLCNKQPDWENHTYFPRLSTVRCGWIDWSWDGQQIEDFCNAFSEPYPGARSFINERPVIVKEAVFKPGSYFHPYCYGLIINKIGARLNIAVKGGTLEASFALNEPQGSDISITQGDRFVTPSWKLEQARERVRYNSKGLAEKNNG